MTITFRAAIYGAVVSIALATTGQSALAAGVGTTACGKTRNRATSQVIGTFMYVNDNHRARWYMVIGSDDGGAGWNDVTYVNSPASLFPALGLIYATHDAGRHWSRVKL